MSHASGIVLLAIRGTLAPKTIEEARQVHNETAGNPQGVEAARALGDLSHNVFVPLSPAAGGAAGEILFLDQWNNPAGIQQFFSDAHVQAGAGLMFTSRDPVVFAPADDCASYALATPAGKNDRFVGLLRATVRSRSVAADAFNAMTKASMSAARRAGQISHHVFYRMTGPGEPPSLDLLGVDVWMDAASMGGFYSDPQHLAPLKDAFAGPPVTSVWKQPAGEWREW